MTKQQKKVRADVTTPATHPDEATRMVDAAGDWQPRKSGPGEQTPRYLSMAQVAERYGVHYKLVNALVNDGTLPSIRLSRNAVRIPVAHLEAWEQAQLTRGGK